MISDMPGKKDFVFRDSEESKNLTRNNHYVPQWYQKGFSVNGKQLHYLNLSPDEITLKDGRVVKHNEKQMLPPSKCFFEYDLYTTFYGPFISDLIETKLFGEIDNIGAKAVKAFIDGSESDRHHRFIDFFNYIDAQKTRTPKGLTWLKEKFEGLDQFNLMMQMQAIQQMHCTIWLEGTREIVSAKESTTKFIISDHPVTIYNYTSPPDSKACVFPNDPPIALKATQTIFPLDRDHCLILTNYEFASDPELKHPNQKRTNARNFGETLVNTNTFLRDRMLTEQQVREINYVIKKRARRYIAAEEKEWLYPETDTNIKWSEIRHTLLPPANKIYKFGGEMFVGTRSGQVHYQDAFGRTSRDTSYLNKEPPKTKILANDKCPCGQGKKYKNCCRDKEISKRPTWEVYSIRERNLILYAQINKILGFDKGKDWNDIRRELSSEQVKEIHQAFGDLWPPETDIMALLPKSDGKIRALYNGVIDVASITQYATSATLYFDEILIQHTFINPNGLKGEFNPVEHPSKFKQQTLKTLALFLALQPFIATGKINMVPDPGIFNKHLRFDAVDSAKKRRDGILEVNEQERKNFEDLMKEDHERMMYSLSPEQKRAQIKKTFPKANEDMIKRLLLALEERRQKDSLALLQDDLYTNGGQVNMNSLAPNFEMALFLAHITGAVLITDSPTRWQEFTTAQATQGTLTTTRWSELIALIGAMNFPFNYELEAVCALWWENRFGKMRKAWQHLYEIVYRGNQVDSAEVTKHLQKELLEACEHANEEMIKLKDSVPHLNPDKYSFTASFTCIIPSGGIADTNVLRLLLTSGLEEYAKNVPMAIFLNIRN
jgi:uncharacterized protein YchJ